MQNANIETPQAIDVPPPTNAAPPPAPVPQLQGGRDRAGLGADHHAQDDEL